MTTVLPLHHGAERDRAILDAFQSGAFAVSWVPLSVDDAGHHAVFSVTADALKLTDVVLPVNAAQAKALLPKARSHALKGFLTFVAGGGAPDARPFPKVRVNVSANLLQRIADALDASLLTPKLADRMFLQTKLSLAPSPQEITSDTWAMIDHSLRIDEQIAKAGGRPEGEFVATPGKDWVIGKELVEHPGKALNYGWHFHGPSYDGQTWESAVTPGLRVIQGVGSQHNGQHSDYSQNARLVKKEVVVDDRPMSLADVLTSPQLAPLASHEGALSPLALRQPGVAKSGFGNEPYWIEKAPFGVGMAVGAVLGSVGGPAGAIAGMAVGFVVDWIRKYKL